MTDRNDLTHDLTRAALDLAARGWHVFPLRPARRFLPSNSGSGARPPTPTASADAGRPDRSTSA